MLYRLLCLCLTFVRCSPKVYRADVTKIDSLRAEVESSFDQMVVQLEKRRKEILKELDVIEDTLLREQEQTDKLIRILEDGHDYSRFNNDQSKFLNSIMHQHTSYTEHELRELKYHRSKSVVVFVWDDDVFQDFNKLWKIILKEKVPYHEKIHPDILTGRMGSRIGEIDPYGLAIDPKSNNIFIVDYSNNRVQVFDPVGKYLYTFGENGPGKLNRPVGITIFDDKVYVSVNNRQVNIYELKGDYINQFGNTGAESEVTSDPRGIAISEINGDIYVCDSVKDIILVYSKDLSYRTSFGKGELLNPRDIELSQDRIYILDGGNPCIHIFNRDHSYSHSIISRGTGEDVGISSFFTLDIEDNILITDRGRDVVSIFTKGGDLIHQIGKGTHYFNNPFGIAINGMNRIVVADGKEEGSIKIF